MNILKKKNARNQCTKRDVFFVLLLVQLNGQQESGLNER